MADLRNVNRTPTKQWGRLKNVTVDPLEEMGLPSKGDQRLLDFDAQQAYFGKIVERYMRFCGNSGGGSQLEKQFTSLSVSPLLARGKGDPAHDKGAARENETPPPPLARARTSPTKPQAPPGSHNADRELSTVLMAMRKLREATVASKRVDAFTIQVYVFCIRASILVKHVESYHPALLHVLHVLHPASSKSLSRSEYQELLGYYVLDLACRQQDFAAAYAARHTLADSEPTSALSQDNYYSYAGKGRVDAVLQAVVHDNYLLFWRLKQSVDGYQAKLMEFAEDSMRTIALKCLGRAYLSVDKGYVVKSTAMSNWEELKERYGVGWELEGSKVIIRKPSRR